MYDDRAHHEARLAQSGALLAAAQSLEDVVAALRQTARRAIGADGIAVVLRDGDLCHYVAEDANQVLWRGQRFPLETCVSGWAMLNDEIAVIPDVRADPRVPLAPYRNKSICSLVMAPIGSPTPVAALGAYWSAMVDPGEGPLSRLTFLASRATAALRRIRVDADVRHADIGRPHGERHDA